MPAAPALRMMVLSVSICAARAGPSSSTSYQSAGLKFSMAQIVSPKWFARSCSAFIERSLQISSPAFAAP